MANTDWMVENGIATQEVAEAEAQLSPAEMRERLSKLINESPSRARGRFTPDYSLTKEYEELSGVDTSKLSAKEAEDHAKKLFSLKKFGTFTDAERQKAIDYSLNSPLSESFRLRNEYRAEIERLEKEIDSFSVDDVQEEADAITAEYKQRMAGANAHQRATLKAEYDRDIDELEYRKIVLPKNDLKVKRAELVERYKVADQRIQLFVSLNREAIERQIEVARDAEIAENLLSLAEYMEG